MKKRHIRIDNSKEVYDSESISYINSLSDLIEEFYEVSKKINTTKKSIIKILEEQLNTSKSTLDKNLKEINSNQIDLFKNYLENIKDIFNMLNFQDISGEKNIFSFFEEAKILINKIKEKSQESILKNRINGKLSLNYKSSNSFNNSLKNRTFKQIIKKENGSFLNLKNKDIEDNILSFYNYTTYSDVNSQYFKKIYDECSNKNQRNDYTFKNFEYTPISLNNKNSVINQNKEIRKLKIRNKKLFSKKISLETNIKKEKNSQTLDRDESILKYEKKNILNTPIELMQMINNYKKEIEKLKKENIILKKGDLSLRKDLNKDNNIIINNKGSEKNLKVKLNSVANENITLKKNIEEINSNSLRYSKIHNNSKNKNPNINNIFLDNNNLTQINSNENEFLKKKINIREKQLIFKQKKIDEL